MKEFVKKLFFGFSSFEKVFFGLAIFSVAVISFLMKDSKIALLSSLCGITYTIFAGKGRVFCYYIGIIGTICYCFLSYKNGFFGNLCLYGLYYLPMEIIGIFNWKKNLKQDGIEIKKTRLHKKEAFLYLAFAVFLSLIASCILKFTGDRAYYIDAITTVFSIFGQFLTVKRCYEQWYIWFIVNVLSFYMWYLAFINGSNCFATVLMWGIYLVLNFYFMNLWKRELNIK